MFNIKNKYLKILLFMLILLFSLSCAMASPTYEIETDNNDDALSPGSIDELNEEIKNAENGGTVYLDNSKFALNEKKPIEISKNLTIDGRFKGAKDGYSVFDGNERFGSFFKVMNNTKVTFINIKFINGLNEDPEHGGGAIQALGNGAVTVDNCLFNKNYAMYAGGAIYSYSGNIIASNSVFGENTGYFTGGAIYTFNGNLTISDSKFTKNDGGLEGGALFAYYGSIIAQNSIFIANFAENGGAIVIHSTNQLEGRADIKIPLGTMAIINCTFINNSATAGAGGAIRSAGDLIVENSTFENNTATSMGGAIFTPSSAIIRNSTFTSNKATEGAGGAIIVQYDLDISNSQFNDNYALKDGGAIYHLYGTANIANTSFCRNKVKELSGGAISSNYILNVENCTFINNTASYTGGAIFNSEGGVYIGNSVFISNENGADSEYGGGAVYGHNSFMVIHNSTFTDNNANKVGGAIYTYGSRLMVENCTFANNTASEYGGAAFIQATIGSFVGCDFINNSAKLGGSAISAGEYSVLKLANGTIENAASENGGAIYLKYGNLTIVNTTFVNCSAKYSGGAVYSSDANTTIDRITVKNGKALNGGALFTSGKLTVSNSTFENATATTGGAIYTYTRDNVNIANSTFSKCNGNTGGAIYAYYNTLNVDNCSFTDNKGDNGGAIYATGTLKAANSKFINNQATNYGGAIYGSGAAIDLKGCELKGNGANSGGAIYAADASSIIIANSNLTDNTAKKYSGGAIYATGLTDIEIENSDISRNSAANNGGGICLDGDARLNKVNLTSNTAKNGAAIYEGGSGKVTLIDCEVKNSKASQNGAVYGNDGSFIIAENSKFIENEGYAGAAIYAKGSANVKKSEFSGNVASKAGGAIYGSAASEITVTESAFEENNAENGPAASIYGYKTTVTDSSFKSTASKGGVEIFAVNNVADIKNTQFDTNLQEFNEGSNIVAIPERNTAAIGEEVRVNLYTPIEKAGTVTNSLSSQPVSVMGLGTVTLNNLAEGKNEVTFSYSGNADIDAGQDIAVIYVNQVPVKEPAKIFIDDMVAYEGQNVVFTGQTSLKSGTLTVKVNGNTYTANVNQGAFSVDLGVLAIGNYPIEVSFAGDDQWESADASADISVVGKVATSIAADDITATAGDRVILEGTTSGIKNGETIKVTVGSKEFAGIVQNNRFTVNLGTFTYGQYPIELSYDGDIGHEAAIAQCSLNVARKSVDIIISDINAYAGETIILRGTTSGIENGETVKAKIGDREFAGTVDNEQFSIAIGSFLSGTYPISVSYIGDATYDSATANINLNVAKRATAISAGDISAYPENEVIVQGTVSGIPEGSEIKATVDDAEYYATVTDGGFSLYLGSFPEGEYQIAISYAGDDIYESAAANIKLNVAKEKSDVNLKAPDIVKHYKNGTQFAITLTDSSGNPIAGAEITVTIAGKPITAVTDSRGIAAVDIDNEPNTYEAKVFYGGSDIYKSAEVTSTITVKENRLQISGQNMVMIHQSGTSFTAIVKDSDNRPVKGVKVGFRISGETKTYYRTTDESGKAYIAINRNPNSYTIISSIEDGGRTVSVQNTITIKANVKTITAGNLNMVYGDGKSFTATVKDALGNPVKGITVGFKLNKESKTYSRTTDANGVASIAINRNPGVYTIVSSIVDNGKTVSKSSTITISPKPVKPTALTVKGTDLNIVYGKGGEYKLTVKDSSGKGVSGIKVGFRIDNEAKVYYRTTDANGVASISISRSIGTHTIYSTLQHEGKTYTASNKITISKGQNTITAANINIVYGKGGEFKAVIKDPSGKPVSGIKVGFKISGESKTYYRTTDANGVASITINRSPNTYTMISSLETGQSVKSTITVRRA